MIRLNARHIGRLSAVILLHAGFIYALQSGLLRQATQVFPQEIVASFITAQPAPQPELPKPPPIAPKPVPVPKKKAIASPARVAPAITPAPSQQAMADLPALPSFDPPAVEAPAAPPVAAAAPAQPKTISGVEYIQAPRPDYPPLAKRMGEQGKVVLRVLVNERGHPERAEVQKSSGSIRLDEAARQGALRALFKPHREDGKAIAVYALVPINFSIQ
jgi:protein TonB